MLRAVYTRLFRRDRADRAQLDRIEARLAQMSSGRAQLVRLARLERQLQRIELDLAELLNFARANEVTQGDIQGRLAELAEPRI